MDATRGIVSGKLGGEQMCVFVKDDRVVELVGVGIAISEDIYRGWGRVGIEKCLPDRAIRQLRQSSGVVLFAPVDRQCRRNQAGSGVHDERVSLLQGVENIERAGTAGGVGELDIG